MTGRVLDNSSAGILILIIPVAFVVLVLYKFWLVLLILALLIVAWKAWQNYQWEKWSAQVNPYFNQLVRDNKGYLTPLDLSVVANLTSRSAKVFLERKADEYGVAPKQIKDKGVVYYFPTASALGRIFDDSEPFGDFDDEEEETSTTPQLVSAGSASKPPSKSLFRELAEQKAKQEQNQTTTQVEPEPSTSAESIQVDAPMPAATATETQPQDSATTTEQSSLSLSQADLSDRLEVHSSTVGRRKSQPDFPEWSQSRDPEGVAWRYLEEEQIFVPLET
ncbi:hypothetical protein Sta7437_3801 [Stanieria cyanosphaera PCC 7437]|uniref:Uncharacterized protein n=1 Tax=Stanieria cyanosphaera (strain ATCC 29371 / PCC 7437) TaxID=111780 RepID=K9XXN8_STAC7|nr:hypothetical protein [Stanieria cyanosphaera]AFZ37288.1 hypothetical protein Sta7437_3801 [Stanieria cyanosphaera PCC 7437]